MHAGPILCRRKPQQAEVARLYGGGNVVAADLPPPHQILRWDQDATVGSRSAAGAAG